MANKQPTNRQRREGKQRGQGMKQPQHGQEQNLPQQQQQGYPGQFRRQGHGQDPQARERQYPDRDVRARQEGLHRDDDEDAANRRG